MPITFGVAPFCADRGRSSRPCVDGIIIVAPRANIVVHFIMLVVFVFVLVSRWHMKGPVRGFAVSSQNVRGQQTSPELLCHEA